MAKKQTNRLGDGGAWRQPSVGVLVKLGSLVVHCEEFFSSDGHHFDKAALDQLIQDPEIREWLALMKGKGLLPEKRKPGG